MVLRVLARGAATAVLVTALAPIATAAGPGTGPTAGPVAGGGTAASIVVDVGSGAVLAAEAHHEPRPVAGAVKLMTALTALQRVAGDWTVSTSARADDAPSPSLGMDEGTDWEILDVLQGMLLGSANDAAYALAESSAGSLDAFAVEMETLGARLGLADSTFGDPAGIEDETAAGGPTTMSPWDLAIVARAVLGVPELAEIVALPDYRVVFPGGIESGLLENGNNFLTQYDGATGMIAGSTDSAGEVLVASATRDGRALVAVVLGTEDPVDTASALLDQGFASPPPARGSGSGDRLPDNPVVTAEGRRVTYLNLPRLLGRPELPVGAQGPGAPVEGPAGPAPEGPTGSGDAPAADDGFPVFQTFAVVVLVLAVVLVALRRRAIHRQRRRRELRQKRLVDARRRGTLDVIEPSTARESTHVRVIRE